MDFVSLAILLILLAGVVIGIVLVYQYTSVARKLYLEGTSQTLEIDTARCKYDLSKLVDITQKPCCIVAGVLRPLKYVDSLDAIVSPSPTNYLVACSGFCTTGVDSTNPELCTGANAAVDQPKYTACINVAKPTGCSDAALPVATTNSSLYYIYSAGNTLCQEVDQCGSLT